MKNERFYCIGSNKVGVHSVNVHKADMINTIAMNKYRDYLTQLEWSTRHTHTETRQSWKETVTRPLPNFGKQKLEVLMKLSQRFETNSSSVQPVKIVYNIILLVCMMNIAGNKIYYYYYSRSPKINQIAKQFWCSQTTVTLPASSTA